MGLSKMIITAYEELIKTAEKFRADEQGCEKLVKAVDVTEEISRAVGNG